MAKIPMPSATKKGPMMGSSNTKPTVPSTKLGQIARGVPERGSGSDTNPYSSARKGSK